MSKQQLDALDLERHLRLLQSASDAEGVAVCAPDGSIVASRGGVDVETVRSVLEEHGADAREAQSSGGGVFRADLGAAGLLLQAPLLHTDGSRAAWIYSLHREAADPSQGTSPRREAPESELADVARTLTTELRLRAEVDDLVTDLSARHEELNLVYDFGMRGGVIGEDEAGTRSLLKSFADYLDVDVVAIAYSNSNSGGQAPPVVVEREPGSLDEIDLISTQLAGDVMRFVSAARAPVVVNEADHALRAHVLVNLPYRVLACPILDGSIPIAMLAMVRRPEGREFSNSDRSLVSMLATQTAVIIRDRRKLEQMERFSAEMAAALIEAIEAKDPYTRGHSERVQAVSTDLARAADLYASDVEDVSWGALLHDVGKIGVPDAVLCKRGRLTADEYTLIKIHPERSYQILRHVAGLRENVLSAARYHQEKFDGTGYPHGLRGTQIPIHARLIAVADTYDAITSSRSYRPGQRHSFAMDQIRQAGGTQLDPRFVEVFEKLCATQPSWVTQGGAQPAPADD